MAIRGPTGVTLRTMLRGARACHDSFAVVVLQFRTCAEAEFFEGASRIIEPREEFALYSSCTHTHTER